MTPLRAALPYKTLDAPLMISICSKFSSGRNPQVGRPASPLKTGKSSIMIMTREPAP